MLEDHSERWGVFTPREVDALAGELEAGDRADESPAQREERARAIIARKMEAATRRRSQRPNIKPAPE